MAELSERRQRIKDMSLRGHPAYTDKQIGQVLDGLENRKSYRQISEETGVKPGTIGCVKNGSCYTHVQ